MRIAETRFTLRLRIPGWCKDWTLAVNGEAHNAQPDETGYIALDRGWQAGDTISLTLDMPVRAVTDRLGNPGRVAFVRGPLVYAADNAYLADGSQLDDVIVPLSELGQAEGLELLSDEASGYPHLLVPALTARATAGAELWREGLRYSTAAGYTTETAAPVRLVPFFDAGNRDERRYREGIWPHWHDPARRVTFQVWLPCAPSASQSTSP